MGSFDETCGVSGLSLGLHQPVKMYFIASNYNFDVICYPTSLYVPCSFGIDMKYDDYGRYEFDTQQPAWRDFVRFLRNQAMHIPEGEDEQEFDPENPDHFDPEYLFDAMCDGGIRLKKRVPCDPDCIKVYPFPIHRDVFNDVCMAPGRDVCNKPISVDTFMKGILEKTEICSLSKDSLGSLCSVFLPRHTERLYGGYAPWESYLECEELARCCAELEMLYHCCQVNRIMFVPTMSAGQSFHYKENAAFHSGCAKIARKLQKELNNL
jgi:hypothetical protein